MKIAVRLDDITPDMDWERFLSCKALLDEYHIKPLIGVVPDNQDENLRKKEQKKELAPLDFWAYLKQLEKEGWVIAMHGYRHVYATRKGGLFPLNDFSEFAGESLERQKEMLAAGKKILAEKGIETDLFMAPAHSYDSNTLKALKECGFRALTDGFGHAPYAFRGLLFYPISFQLSSTLRKKKGYSTMVIHTDTVTEKERARYREYFESAQAEWISYQEYLKQPAGTRRLPGRVKEFLMAKGKYLLMKLR